MQVTRSNPPPIADLNMDGVVNSTDNSLWSDLLYSTSNSAVYADSDLDFDGLDDWNSGGADGDLFYESYTANTGLSGVGRVSSPGVDSRTGYAGYQWDQTISASHVRYRVYLPDIGRWTRRDPLGYVDGESLYEYVSQCIVRKRDPMGLCATCLNWPHDPSLVPLPQPEPSRRLVWDDTWWCSITQQADVMTNVFKIEQVLSRTMERLAGVDPNIPSTYIHLLGACKFDTDAGLVAAAGQVLAALKSTTARMLACMQSKRPIFFRCAPYPGDQGQDADVFCYPWGTCTNTIYLYPSYWTLSDNERRRVLVNELSHVCMNATDGHDNTLTGYFNDSNSIDAWFIGPADAVADNVSRLCSLANQRAKCRLGP